MSMYPDDFRGTPWDRPVPNIEEVEVDLEQMLFGSTISIQCDNLCAVIDLIGGETVIGFRALSGEQVNVPDWMPAAVQDWLTTADGKRVLNGTIDRAIEEYDWEG